MVKGFEDREDERKGRRIKEHGLMDIGGKGKDDSRDKASRCNRNKRKREERFEPDAPPSHGSEPEGPPPGYERSEENNNSLLNGFKYEAKKRVKLVETDLRRLEQRQKQIDKGKNTLGYQYYLSKVPRKKRSKNRSIHPSTPDVSLKTSKRAFDGLLRAWRRSLHRWDPEIKQGQQVIVTAPPVVVSRETPSSSHSRENSNPEKPKQSESSDAIDQAETRESEFAEFEHDEDLF